MPRKLHCHAHWMVNDIKMSKSKGNVINPFDYLESYKADGIRYFLLKTGVPHADGSRCSSIFDHKKNVSLILILSPQISMIKN